MEIDWSEAPEWANWVAIDANGEWFWFENEPKILSIQDIWDVKDGNVCPYELDDDPCDWKSSLRTRYCTFNRTNALEDNPTPSHYNHTLNGVKIDPYKIADIYNITSYPQFHALKKILRAHQPNHKSLEQNIDEAISALQRWKEIINE